MKLLNETLSQIVACRKETLHTALMTHVVLGYPTIERSIEIVLAMAEAGAEIIEVQIPFSDPLADGPTIMFANQEALDSGVTPPDCFEAIARITKVVKVPILIMSYFNIPFSYKGGVAGFCKAAHDAGASGLIIPDIPPEEFQEERLREICAEQSLQLIPLVSPLTPERRLKLLSSSSGEGGFVYCVSTTGTTGARHALPPDLGSYTERVRRYFQKPLALGFGISTPEQVKAAGEHVEIAIVGSATIDILRKTEARSQLDSVKKFVEDLTRVQQ